MNVKIKKTNLKRLASLSALGAGALSVGAGSAEASSIVFSGPVNAQVGFCPHCLTQFNLLGPAGARGSIHLSSYLNSSGRGARSVFVAGSPAGKHGTALDFVKSAGSFVAAFPQGVEWGSRKTTGPFALAAFSFVEGSGGGHSVNSPFNATDRYLLFRFTGGDFTGDVYGWAQIAVRYSPKALCSHRAPGCVDVTLIDYAYDTSGHQIPAGDTGVPEPSTLSLTGLAALALGAKGLRTWRTARRASVV
jgi:hypothetical protein